MDRSTAYVIEQRGTAAQIQVKKEPEVKTKEPEFKTKEVKAQSGAAATAAITGPAMQAHYAQECQAPPCLLKQSIAKQEQIAKVRPLGRCHWHCAEEMMRKLTLLARKQLSGGATKADR